MLTATPHDARGQRLGEGSRIPAAGMVNPHPALALREGHAIRRDHVVSTPHREQRRVAGKPANVLRTLERTGVRTILLTHNAFDFGQGFALVLLQPCDQLHFDPLDVRDPMTHQRAA